jgi:hypothetical protein
LKKAIDAGYNDYGRVQLDSDLDNIRKEKDFVAKHEDKHIWTLIEEDGKMFIQNGAWWVNRLAYFVCKEPCLEEKGSISLKY